MPSTAKRPGRVVTFYSYKGGTGRSMALANVAWILACAGKRVLVIDWDLEAPGLHRYFRPFLLDAELSASDGLIDLIDRYATAAIAPKPEGTDPPADWYRAYADFGDYVIPLDFEHFPPGGRIDLLPAGRQCDTYAVKVSSFNWQNFYDRLGGGAFLEAVKQKARDDYDWILIDSRTGVSDTAGICTAQLPDSLVVCFTYNNQSIKGAAAVARSAVATQAQLMDERATRTARSGEGDAGIVEDTPRPYVVYPVPMRVDAGESERLALRQAFARQSFADLVGHLGASGIESYWSGVEVPHRVFYAYEEVLAPFKDDAHDPKTVLAAFLRLTAWVTDREVTDFRLPIAPDVRQRYLDAYAETPLTAVAREQRAEAQRESAEQALVRNADAAIYALDAQDREAAQHVLCRLVRIGRDEEGGGAFPIRAAIGDFDASQRAVIGQLARRGVVGVASDATRLASWTLESQSVGYADARLVTLWPTLARWLEADRDFLLWRQQLRNYLADWDRSGSDSGAFLSGTLLAEAQLMRHRRGADLNAVERAYVDASAAHAARAAEPSTNPGLPPGFRASYQDFGVEPPPAPASTATAAHAAPARSRPVRVAAVAAVLVLAAVGGWWWFGRSSNSIPPTQIVPTQMAATDAGSAAAVGVPPTILTHSPTSTSSTMSAATAGSSTPISVRPISATSQRPASSTLTATSPSPGGDEDPAFLYSRGVFSERAGKIDSAVADYNKALQRNPDAVVVLLARARLLEKRSPSLARADYTRVLALPANESDRKIARAGIEAIDGTDKEREAAPEQQQQQRASAPPAGRATGKRPPGSSYRSGAAPAAAR